MRRIVLSCLFVAAAAVSGCGSSSSSTTTTTTTSPATPATTATAATTPATTATSSPASTSSSSGLDGVPAYQPSSTVSRAPHSLIIASPDSVTKVGSYYSSTFAGGGWVTVSKTVTPYSASFTVKKGGQGASVVVSPKGSGSSVAITSYTTSP
jgi:hypothetical protein